jgi:hypothetical protein
LELSGINDHFGSNGYFMNLLKHELDLVEGVSEGLWVLSEETVSLKMAT